MADYSMTYSKNTALCKCSLNYKAKNYSVHGLSKHWASNLWWFGKIEEKSMEK